MTAPMPDPRTDRAGYVTAVADMAVAQHGPDHPRHAMWVALAALWRGVAERHRTEPWYQECVDHPEPDEDAAEEVAEAWHDTHTYGDEFVTCDENKLGLACVGCTETRYGDDNPDGRFVAGPCPDLLAVVTACQAYMGGAR